MNSCQDGHNSDIILCGSDCSSAIRHERELCSNCMLFMKNPMPIHQFCVCQSENTYFLESNDQDVYTCIYLYLKYVSAWIL